MYCISRHYIIILLFWFALFRLFSLESLPFTNPYLVSSSNITTLSNNPSNAILNPAAGESGISTSTCYLYGMHNLHQYELTSVVDYNNYGVIVCWQAMDADNYSRQDYRLGIRYGFRSVKVAIGYRLSYDEITGYGSERDSNPYAGLRVNYLHTTLDAAANKFLSTNESRYSQSMDYNISLGQEIVSNTIVAFGLASSAKAKTNFKAGCRFPVYDNLQTIVSWESEPGRFGFASDFAVGWMHICYGLQTHNELDWTHSIGLSVLFP